MTLVIQLNTALTVQSEELRGEAKRVWDRLGTVDALTKAVINERIIAMPKYDSSRCICDKLQTELGSEIPGDDKYLLGLILQAGEFLTPQQVPNQPWSSLHFRSEREVELAATLEQAIKPLKERSLKFTYFKPSEFSPAFRIEFKSHTSKELWGRMDLKDTKVR